MAFDILKQFRNIPILDANRIGVAQLSERPASYVGKSSDGSPCIIIETSRRNNTVVSTKGMKLSSHSDLQIDFEGVTQNLSAVLLSCADQYDGQVEAFLHLGYLIIQRLGYDPDLDAVSLLRDMIELLDSASIPSRKGEIGLFAEMLVLHDATDPVLATECWRVEEGETHDIALDEFRLEVKASGTRERRHFMSMDQSRSAVGAKVLIASTMVLPCGGGTRIWDLAKRLQSKISGRPDLMHKVEAATLQVAGVNNGAGTAFDEHTARDRMRWFDADELPSLHGIPTDIDQIRYRLLMPEEIGRSPAECVEKFPQMSGLTPKRD